MSANIVKVTIEDTHPPVWRRLALPESITYKDLHNILQTAFGWYDCHLHDFSFPNSYHRVVMSGEDKESPGDVLEKNAIIDDDLKAYKWIRYTYDFGDDWRHRITFEKEDPMYSSRFPKVIKWKGDNFNEDVGGVWGAYDFQREKEQGTDEDDDCFMEPRRPFNLNAVNERLADMKIPVRKKKKTSEKTDRKTARKSDDFNRTINQLMRQLKRKAQAEELLKDSCVMDNASDLSPMRNMMSDWTDFSNEFVSVMRDYTPASSNLSGDVNSIRGLLSRIPDDSPEQSQASIPMMPSDDKEARPASQYEKGEQGQAFPQKEDTNKQMFIMPAAGTEFEQLSLFPDSSNEAEQTNALDAALPAKPKPDYREIRIGKYAIRYSIGNRTMEENISRLSASEIRDYCRYLGLPYTSGNKKDRVIAYCQEIKAHPECLLYVLSQESLECLMLMLEGQCEKDGILDTEAIPLAMSLGLVECKTKRGWDEKRADLTFASDAEWLLRRAIEAAAENHLPVNDDGTNSGMPVAGDYYLPMFDAGTNAKLDGWYELIDKQDERILAFLEAYGFLEIDRLYKLCTDLGGIDMSKKDFERYVYWHLRVPDVIVTFSDFHTTKYAGIQNIDIKRAMIVRNLCCGGWDYKEITKDAYEKWLLSPMDVYKEWEEFSQLLFFLSQARGLAESDIGDLLVRSYYMVLDGCNVYELCSEICSSVELKGLMEYTSIWKGAVNVLLSTGLPALMGYSRFEYEAKIRDLEKDRFDLFEQYLPVYRDDRGAGPVKKDTHLFELGNSDIRIILHYMDSEDAGRAIMDGSGIINEIKTNEEFQTLFMMIEDSRGNKNRARTILDQLIKNHQGWNEDLIEYRKSLGPAFRTGSKVYPNDPCPCGSGKKYKKCCGKGK